MAGRAVGGRSRPAMAGDTPAHFVGSHLADFIHLFDDAVAVGAVDPGFDMALVRKIDKPGKLVKPFPDHRFFAEISISHLNNFRPINSHILVTGHAGFQRGRSGLRGFVHIRMAEGTIHSKLSGMDTMLEGDRLRRRFAEGLPVPAGEKYPDRENAEEAANKYFEKYFSHMFE